MTDGEYQLLIRVLSSLTAAVALIERAEAEKRRPSKVVASDTIFKMMVDDYKKAAEAARVALLSVRPR